MRKRLSVIALLLVAVLAAGMFMCGCDANKSDGSDKSSDTSSTVLVSKSKADLLEGDWVLVKSGSVKGSFHNGTATITYNGKEVSGGYSINSSDDLVFDDVTYTFSSDVSGADLSSGESPFSGNEWYINEDYLVIAVSVYKRQ